MKLKNNIASKCQIVFILQKIPIIFWVWKLCNYPIFPPFSIICQQEVNWFRSRLPNINRENMYKWYQKKLY